LSNFLKEDEKNFLLHTVVLWFRKVNFGGLPRWRRKELVKKEGVKLSICRKVLSSRSRNVLSGKKELLSWNKDVLS